VAVVMVMMIVMMGMMMRGMMLFPLVEELHKNT